MLDVLCFFPRTGCDSDSEVLSGLKIMCWTLTSAEQNRPLFVTRQTVDVLGGSCWKRLMADTCEAVSSCVFASCICRSSCSFHKHPCRPKQKRSWGMSCWTYWQDWLSWCFWPFVLGLVCVLSWSICLPICLKPSSSSGYFSFVFCRLSSSPSCPTSSSVMPSSPHTWQVSRSQKPFYSPIYQSSPS